MNRGSHSTAIELPLARPEERTTDRDQALPKSPRGRPFARVRPPLLHRIVEWLIAAMAMGAVAAIALIFVFIGREALPLFFEQDAREEAPLSSLFAPREWPGYDEPVFVWQPVGTPPKYNVVPLFVGSLKVTFLAMLLSAPVAIAAAIFTTQYAPRRLREILKPIIELLAGIPSVVLGFFALMILASWAQALFGFELRLNAVVAAMGLSLAIIPIVFTITEDAIQAVPKHLAEAALALGAERHQVTLKVILPAALPGTAASVILGFGRAIGETMIVLMASGNAAMIEVLNPAASVRTVTATIAAELGEVAVGDPHWRVLFMLGVMLFGVTFLLNLIGTFLVRRLHRRLTAA